MKSAACIITFLAIQMAGLSQTYFPPTTGNWETITWEEAGLCPDSLPALINLLEQEDSKAFILLYNGKILNESYFDSFTADSIWYWASAGKTLTSALIGIAAAQNGLNLDASSKTYLGAGWSNLTSTQEDEITVRHHLTMTTGLDDGVVDNDCTSPSCLQYLAQPNTRWAYHNAPYTLLDQILQGATSFTNNQYFFQKIGTPCGISGLFVNSGYNKIFYSTPRNMAKFGLLLQNQGLWNGASIIPNAYHTLMTTPSQTMNESYGYLTWLNGQNSYMVPESQWVLPGMMAPHAPNESYAALGKNGQIINVSPNENLTWIRMGNGNSSLISLSLWDTIWSKLQHIQCSNSTDEHHDTKWVTIKNNGHIPEVYFKNLELTYSLMDMSGRSIEVEPLGTPFLFDLSSGLYTISCPSHPEWLAEKIWIQH